MTPKQIKQELNTLTKMFNKCHIKKKLNENLKFDFFHDHRGMYSELRIRLVLNNDQYDQLTFLQPFMELYDQLDNLKYRGTVIPELIEKMKEFTPELAKALGHSL